MVVLHPIHRLRSHWGSALVQAGVSVSNLSDGQISGLYHQLDSDQDGVVGYHDFIAFLSQADHTAPPSHPCHSAPGRSKDQGPSLSRPPVPMPHQCRCALYNTTCPARSQRYVMVLPWARFDCPQVDQVVGQVVDQVLSGTVPHMVPYMVPYRQSPTKPQRELARMRSRSAKQVKCQSIVLPATACVQYRRCSRRPFAGRR